MAKFRHPQAGQPPVVVGISASLNNWADGAWQKELHQHIGVGDQH
jgi:hypothetical protein